MRWRGVAPNVYVLDEKYELGIKLTRKEMKPYAQRLTRSPKIERWSVFINQPELAT